jgi:transposase
VGPAEPDFVLQSGERDRRGTLTKQGPKYLRWAMLEATMHALRHPAYAERYQRNKTQTDTCSRHNWASRRGGH